MSKTEQKRLYEHYKKLSKDGNTSIQRENAKKNGAEILKSFPEFEKPVKVEKPVKETKPVKEK